MRRKLFRLISKQPILVACISLSILFIHIPKASSKDQDNVFRMAAFSKVRTDPPRASNAIINYVMAQAGYHTEFVVTPSKRMQYSLRKGDVDSMQVSALARHYRQSKKEDGFIQSIYPVVSFPAVIYYKQSQHWSPSWPPEKDFQEKANGASINYHYLNAAGLDLTQVRTYEAGGKMVNFGRADYWLEVMIIPAGDSDVRKKKHDDYASQILFDSPMQFLFSDTKKGRVLKQIWDTGFRALMSDPEKFAEVYLEGLPKDYFTKPLNDFTRYINANFSEFGNVVTLE